MSPDDTFLVAKCCQLLLTVMRKKAVQIDKTLLYVAVSWCLQALERSADIALLDILQALEGVIRSYPKDMEEVSRE